MKAKSRALEIFFIDFFVWKSSPYLPLCILNDAVTSKTTDGYDGVYFVNWRIVEKFTEEEASKPLAKIIFRDCPKGVVLLFEFEEEYRERLTPFIKGIETKLKEVGFRITSLREGSHKPKSPTDITRARAEACKKIKDKNPCFSNEMVANEYFIIYHEYISVEAVRNAYRAMKWPFEKSDRVRR
jgi:hypothetical protein